MTQQDKAVQASNLQVQDEATGALLEKNGTYRDQRDMLRIGKIQQLRRNFRFVTIFGFTMVLMATWEAQLVTYLNDPFQFSQKSELDDGKANMLLERQCLRTD